MKNNCQHARVKRHLCQVPSGAGGIPRSQSRSRSPSTHSQASPTPRHSDSTHPHPSHPSHPSRALAAKCRHCATTGPARRCPAHALPTASATAHSRDKWPRFGCQQAEACPADACRSPEMALRCSLAGWRGRPGPRASLAQAVEDKEVKLGQNGGRV